MKNEQTAEAANPHEGSSLEEFLREEGILDEATNRAVRRVIAWQLQRAIAEKKISKTDMAARMATSRRQLSRVLNPYDSKVTLETLQRAARAVGRTLRLDLE
jgi:antitoxin HicB